MIHDYSKCRSILVLAHETRSELSSEGSGLSVPYIDTDTDLMRRISNAGYPVLINLRLFVFHYSHHRHL
jgi:hypothetical protein